MGNTPRIKAVTKPEPVDDGIQLWDEFVQEATPDVEPWQKRMPDGELLTVNCPTSDQLDLVAVHQGQGDVPGMATALFGQDAAKILELTGAKPFTVRVRLINDVLAHYGMSVAQLPES